MKGSPHIDLHCHSTFSLLDGMGTPKEVVERAKQLGWSAACLTEHGWMGSTPTFYKACIENSIKPILGCEMYVVPDEAQGQRSKEFRDCSRHLTVLALSKEGYFNLVAWNTFSMQPENFYYRPRISLQSMAEIASYPLHHNVILTGCLGGELCSGLSDGNTLEDAASYVFALKSLFPNVYVEIQNHRIGRFSGSGFEAYDLLLRREQFLGPRLIELSGLTETPLCVTNDSHFQTTKQRKAHVTMRASAWRHRDDIHHGKSQEQLSVAYLKDYSYFGNYMRDMEKVCNGIPKEALESVAEIVSEANIKLDPLDSFSYSMPFSGYSSPMARIRKRCNSRLEALVEKHGGSAREKFEIELGAMEGFADYLLLLSDFIVHAKGQGILTNTRGSAAASVVCYCLKIHDVDPIHYGLTFSRFFNPARKKLPDIDIDIEKDRYDDFMQYVTERMDELEGQGQVVQICNYGTFANRSSFRTAATALGVPKETQDEISRILPQMIDSGMVDEESDAYEILRDEYPELYEASAAIFDAVKSVGQHACGWLFGTKDRPIAEWVPMYFIASSGRLVSQFDLKALDSMGLVKGDFLRLRSLSVIKRTLTMIGKDALDLEQIPLDDPETFEMLRAGKTEGVFTLQGKENRRGCIEVEVDSVDDVIRTVAIYRPALTREKKHLVYNRRRKGEPVSYPHPIVEEAVGDTYGVPVFQEQVMEIAYAVGMSDAEVDDIYQAIKVAKGVGRGAKEAFEKIHPKFLKRALKMMSQEEADAVWEEYVQGSQGYGFNKAHAASYGILAVRSAYLRCHYPAEFFTSLLDVYPEKSKYIASARGEGFQFLPPSVNESNAGFALSRDRLGIRVGLSRIKGLGPVAVREILEGQPYRSFEDFKERTTARAVNKARVESLAAVGALECLGIKGAKDDALDFELLRFCLRKPKAFRNCKPKHFGERVSDSGWHHLGRERGVDVTEGRNSVSKMFWVPPGAKLELKSSAWAQVKTNLLEVVDENGIVFYLMANEDKPFESKALNFIHRKCQGSVLCVDGAVRMPFLNDSKCPQGFRYYGVTGSHMGDPQVWHTTESYRMAFSELSRMKRRAA
jgi:DNA polymerase III subunit alpha